MNSSTSFTSWVTEHIKEHSETGELARYIQSDASFPKNTHRYSYVYGYLKSHDIDRRIMKRLVDMWNSYIYDLTRGWPKTRQSTTMEDMQYSFTFTVYGELAVCDQCHASRSTCTADLVDHDKDHRESEDRRERLREIDSALLSTLFLPHERGRLLHEALTICSDLGIDHEWSIYKRQLERLQQNELRKKTRQL